MHRPSGHLPGSLPRSVLCVALSSILALGFTVGQLANPPKAHAVVPFVIPAGAAAMGVGAEEALAAFAALGAVTCGWSLKSYCGATSDNIADWTEEQLQKGLDELDEWLGKQIQTDPELAQQWIDAAEVKEGSVSGGPSGGGPSKDPKDYDNNVGWMVLTLLNCSSLATSALGFFADGIKNLMIANGSLEETVTYPDLVVTQGNYTAVVPVVPASSLGAPDSLSSSLLSYSVEPVTDFYYALYRSYTAVPYYYFGPNTKFSVSVGSNGSFGVIVSYLNYKDLPYSSSHNQALWAMSARVLDSDKSFKYVYSERVSDPGDSPTASVSFGSVTSVSPTFAKIIDASYENTTKLDSKHEIADAPQAITGLDSDTIKQYLNQIASNPSTGTYTYVKPTTTVVRNTYKDNLEETETKPEEVSPKPDEPSSPGLVVPDDYHFPDSWTDGSLKLNRMFPFFFFDDMYTIYNTWFPQSSYDSKLRIPLPGIMWGKPGTSKVLVIDFTPWEPYRDFVYYGFLALVMFGFLSRLFEWWGGFAMRMDGDD